MRRLPALRISAGSGGLTTSVATSPGTVALGTTLFSERGIRTHAQVGRGCQNEAPQVRPPDPAAQFGFRWVPILPEVILLAVRWYPRYGLSYRILRNSSQSEASRSTTSRCSAGSRGSRRSWPTPPGPVGTPSPAVGSRTRPTWGVWIVALCVPGSGRARPGHRRVRVEEARYQGRQGFFASAIGVHGMPTEVTTDRLPALARAITELLPLTLHDTTQYANNRVEADPGRLKARLHPMRGLKRDRTASVVMRGHAFIQNLHRGHYELRMVPCPE